VIGSEVAPERDAFGAALLIIARSNKIVVRDGADRQERGSTGRLHREGRLAVSQSLSLHLLLRFSLPQGI
jgi:hypothetical protein